MRLRLAGYARRWTPVSREPTSRKALILGAIIAAHVAVLVVWMVAPTVITQVWGGGEGSGNGTYEVIRYFDITPQSATGEIRLAPALADSLGIVQPTTP